MQSLIIGISVTLKNYGPLQQESLFLNLFFFSNDKFRKYFNSVQLSEHSYQSKTFIHHSADLAMRGQPGSVFRVISCVRQQLLQGKYVKLQLSPRHRQLWGWGLRGQHVGFMISLISLEKVTEVIRLTAEHSLRAMHLLYWRAATIFEAVVHAEHKSFFSMYINALEMPSGDRERLPVQCSISTKYSKLK